MPPLLRCTRTRPRPWRHPRRAQGPTHRGGQGGPGGQDVVEQHHHRRGHPRPGPAHPGRSRNADAGRLGPSRDDPGLPPNPAGAAPAAAPPPHVPAGPAATGPPRAGPTGSGGRRSGPGRRRGVRDRNRRPVRPTPPTAATTSASNPPNGRARPCRPRAPCTTAAPPAADPRTGRGRGRAAGPVGAGWAEPRPAAARRARHALRAGSPCRRPRRRSPQPAQPGGRTRSARSAQSPPVPRGSERKNGAVGLPGRTPAGGGARPVPVRAGSSRPLRTGAAVGHPVRLVHVRPAGARTLAVGRVRRRWVDPGAEVGPQRRSPGRRPRSSRRSPAADRAGHRQAGSPAAQSTADRSVSEVTRPGGAGRGDHAAVEVDRGDVETAADDQRHPVAVQRGGHRA